LMIMLPVCSATPNCASHYQVRFYLLTMNDKEICKIFTINVRYIIVFMDFMKFELCQ
jgi:hypothetical protein